MPLVPGKGRASQAGSGLQPTRDWDELFGFLLSFVFHSCPVSGVPLHLANSWFWRLLFLRQAGPGWIAFPKTCEKIVLFRLLCM